MVLITISFAVFVKIQPSDSVNFRYDVGVVVATIFFLVGAALIENNRAHNSGRL